MKFGLELPQYQADIWACQDAIKKVGTFLRDNGADEWFGLSYMMGPLHANDNDKDDGAYGIIFHGTLQLATSVAEAFPQYRVTDQRGNVILPAGAMAKASLHKKQAGPRR